MPKKTVESEPTVKFVGGSSYITGLPARDMPLTEWLTYPPLLRGTAVKNGIYEVRDSDDPVAFDEAQKLILAFTLEIRVPEPGAEEGEA
jgi:hypothetical protein